MIQDIRSAKDVWKKMMTVLTLPQKKIGIIVMIMSIIGAVLETLGVSVIIPIMQAMVYPEELFENKYFASVLRLLGITHTDDVILFTCVLMIVVYLIKNLYLILLSWVRARYSSRVKRELSVRVMKSYMSRDYSFFLNTTKGNLYRGTMDDAEGTYIIVYNGFHLISEVMTDLFICIYLLMIDVKMALCVIIVGILCLVLVIGVMRPWVKKLGSQKYKYSSLVYKYMMEAYNGIKEITVMQRRAYFTAKYERAYAEQQRAEADSTVSAESPAYIIEAICVSGIMAALALRVQQMNDPSMFLPMLSAFAIAAFRILPSLGRISNSFNSMIYKFPYLDDAYNVIKEVESKANVSNSNHLGVKNGMGENDHFTDKISIDNVSFRYDSLESNVCNSISMTINCGDSIGIVGESGSGKSTLVNILLGLLKPQSGCIIVDGKNISDIPVKWSDMIGYVPQSVYLMDDSIRNNVAFGKDEIDDDKVWKCLEEAQIADFVRNLGDGLETLVGDRGMRISGGQCQRIAIARALYNDPDILVFDEATSALDNATEAELIKSIESFHGKKTLIIVAHRLTTIQKCDIIYEIADGKARELSKRSEF